MRCVWRVGSCTKCARIDKAPTCATHASACAECENRTWRYLWAFSADLTDTKSTKACDGKREIDSTLPTRANSSHSCLLWTPWSKLPTHRCLLCSPCAFTTATT